MRLVVLFALTLHAQPPVHDLNRFAEAYNVWAKTANAHKRGSIDVNEAKQWRDVKREWRTLQKFMDAQYGRP